MDFDLHYSLSQNLAVGQEKRWASQRENNGGGQTVACQQVMVARCDQLIQGIIYYATTNRNLSKPNHVEVQIMSDYAQNINQHYAANDLSARILAALQNAGKDINALTRDD